MTNLNILYIGSLGGTSLDRARSIQRLGHTITHVSSRQLLPKSVWVDRITWRLGGQWFSPLVNFKLKGMLQGKNFDLCFVDNGEWLATSTIRLLKDKCSKVINYNIDDPTGPRDGARFAAYRQAAPEYDLLAVVRQENISELKNLGAKNILRVYRSADEITHKPRDISNDILNKFSSDVLFLGTWMPERGPFLARLIDLGVPLTIIGDNWKKATEFEKLKPFIRHQGSLLGDEYAYAIQCAKVNLGLLSKGNRDLHTTRSLEIPALGGLLCAERTTEHLGMYEEGTEALFWNNAEECAHICLWALEHQQEATLIAQAGHKRFLKNKHGNDDIMNEIIQASLSK